MSMIQWQGLSLVFPHKTCFSNFSGQLVWGQRIALVGDNGSGKSSLLRMLAGFQPPSEGCVTHISNLHIGYVGQVLGGNVALSGGQRVNQALSSALANSPELLLLDEPSNHLDAQQRLSMLRRLRHFHGALVLVTHDVTWMSLLCDALWIIEEGQVKEFNGCYQDYLDAQAIRHAALLGRREQLQRERQVTHERLMKEQERASHARLRGEKAVQQRRWATVKSVAKLGRGSTTAGEHRAALRRDREEIQIELAKLSLGEAIHPRFFLPTETGRRHGPVLQIIGGQFGYGSALTPPLHLVMEAGEQLWLTGANGSGKSTFARAFLGDQSLRLAGAWLTPSPQEVGYLDQHYANLPMEKTVLEVLSDCAPRWPINTLRHHLSCFLFRHDAVLQAPVAALSGGERARLSLACIAARTPQLLILDEVSNNLDHRSRRHVAEILGAYPGTLLLISHDESLVQQLPKLQRMSL